jgi:lipopolysaccharide export system permease protein
MNLIHRHIFANVLATCAAAVAMFGFIVMFGSAMRDLLGHILSGQLALDTAAHLVLLTVPVVVSYALPAGILTGILLVLGRMSSDREITALRSSGLSVAWLSAPVIFLALIGLVVTLLINFEFMPRAKVAYETELAEAVRQNPLGFITPKTFVRDFSGVVIYAGDKKGAVLKDFWIWELDAQNRVKRFARADSGRVDYDEKDNKLILTLQHAQAEVREARDPENFSAASGAATMDQATFDLPLAKLSGSGAIRVKQKWLTFGQLMAEWHRLSRPDATAPEREKQLMRVQITIQDKFAAAFSVLSFSLLAIPLGIKVSRKETSANLVIGLVLFMGYYFATFTVSWLDNRPAWRPDLIMWLPNLSLQTIGLWLFYKLDRS